MPNYVLGAGRVLVGPEGALSGFRLVGNAPSLSLGIERTTAVQRKPDANGILVPSREITVSATLKGEMVVDDMTPDARELLWGATPTSPAQTASAETGYALTAYGGYEYQLGATAQNPTGHKQVSGVVVNGPGAPYTDGVDYTVDTGAGILAIIQGGAISDGDSLTVDYATATASWDRDAPSYPTVSRSIRYEAFNTQGELRDALLPAVAITPTTPLQLIGDELVSISFDLNVTSAAGDTLAYLDGRAI